jgi:hypothetical protein
MEFPHLFFGATLTATAEGVILWLFKRLGVGEDVVRDTNAPELHLFFHFISFLVPVNICNFFILVYVRVSFMLIYVRVFVEFVYVIEPFEIRIFIKLIQILIPVQIRVLSGVVSRQDLSSSLIVRMRDDRFIRRLARVSAWACCLGTVIARCLAMFCACTQPDAPGNTSQGVRDGTKVRKEVSKHDGDSDLVDTI